MNNKPKIAVIGLKGLPAYGGAARAGESVISLLSDKYDFTVLSISSHTSMESGTYKNFRQVVFKSIKHKKLNSFVYYLKCLKYVLFNERFDLIHIHHIDSGFIIPFLRLKYKVLGTARGQTYKVDKWTSSEKLLFKFFEFLFLKYSTVVVGVSKPHIEYYKTITKKPTHYIPNGINIKEPYLSVSENNYLFFAAGRIVKIKGLHLLLKAYQILNLETKIIVAGNLDHNTQYKEEIRKLANNLNVVFIGLIKEKKKLMGYLKVAKYFVFPSLIEGMSNMLLEAASMKTPIICSDIPENKAVFSDQEVLFFKSNNEEDLAEKIKFAFEHPQELKEKALRAYDKLRRDYTWEKIAKQYENLYDNILSQ